MRYINKLHDRKRFLMIVIIFSLIMITMIDMYVDHGLAWIMVRRSSNGIYCD